VLSLGATRRFLIKPRQGGRSVAFTPTGRDLVVMGGALPARLAALRAQADQACRCPVSVNFSSRLQGIRE
jgi:alkylated DNA repair dioxygenase AlkB